MSTDEGDEGVDGVSMAVEWVVLDGDRRAVAVLLLVAVGILVAALELSGMVVRRTSPIALLFTALVGGNLTLITVVLSINQLVLSRELGSMSDLRGRQAAITDFREDVRQTIDRETLPINPAGFLDVIYESARQRAQALGGLSYTEADAGVREMLDDIVADLTAHCDQVLEKLQHSDEGVFAALSASIGTDYSRQIVRLRRLQSQSGDQLSPALEASIDDLLDQLRQIDLARQYFKTIYVQEELAYLSRLLLYVGIPAEIVSIVAVLLLAGPGPVIGPGPIPFGFVTATVTVSLAPLALLFAFVIRVAMIAQETATQTPFTTPD